MDGMNVLADPNFSRHIFFIIRRRSKVPKTIRNLPPIDLILISHAHYDHLDLPTLRRLSRETPIIVPPGVKAVVKWARMKKIIILEEGESYRLGEVAITAVPAKHFPGRPPFFPRTGYQGYVIDGSATVYFAGDSGIFEGMTEIGRKWAIDIALLPIGAYQPPPFRRHHMSPEDALEAGRRLRTKAIVPIHWGTFKLSLEPFDEPTRRLEQAAEGAKLSSKVRILLPGQSVRVGSKGSIEAVG
jgi:L-ascorbate metabolism protein UlaG (beta-lactamase superfamily)